MPGHATSVEFGLDAPRSTLHEAWKRAEMMRWPEALAAESVDN
jgi:hypothetical protein